jgi:hypothetical protein
MAGELPSFFHAPSSRQMSNMTADESMGLHLSAMVLLLLAFPDRLSGVPGTCGALFSWAAQLLLNTMSWTTNAIKNFPIEDLMPPRYLVL